MPIKQKLVSHRQINSADLLEPCLLPNNFTRSHFFCFNPLLSFYRILPRPSWIKIQTGASVPFQFLAAIYRSHNSRNLLIYILIPVHPYSPIALLIIIDQVLLSKLNCWRLMQHIPAMNPGNLYCSGFWIWSHSFQAVLAGNTFSTSKACGTRWSKISRNWSQSFLNFQMQKLFICQTASGGNWVAPQYCSSFSTHHVCMKDTTPIWDPTHYFLPPASFVNMSKQASSTGPVQGWTALLTQFAFGNAWDFLRSAAT